MCKTTKQVVSNYENTVFYVKGKKVLPESYLTPQSGIFRALKQDPSRGLLLCSNSWAVWCSGKELLWVSAGLTLEDKAHSWPGHGRGCASLGCQGSQPGRGSGLRAGWAEHEFQAWLLSCTSVCAAGGGRLMETLNTSLSDPRCPRSGPNVPQQPSVAKPDSRVLVSNHPSLHPSQWFTKACQCVLMCL